ncbi:MAG: glycosyltransferase family 39 protein [bacterium]|nr:glycosyltransferase family 39 protein [bacterium]
MGSKKTMKIILILFLAVFLRLVNLSQSFWLDESISALMAIKPFPFQWTGLGNDFQPPLYYLILHFWQNFGHSEWWLRLPSVIFGTGTVYMVYRLGKELKGENFGFLASFLMAIAPYHIYYSQEARMYSLVVFLTTVAIFFFLKSQWPLYFLTSVFALYTHYFFFFILFSLGIYTIFFKREILKSWLAATAAAGFAFLFWLPTFLVQLSGGKWLSENLPGWSRVSSIDTVKALPLIFTKFSLGQINFDNKILYGVVVLIVLIFYGGLLIRGFKKTTPLITLWLAVPVLTSLALSFFLPVNVPWRLLIVLPAFYLCLAAGVFSLPFPAARIAVLGIAAVSLTSLSLYYLNPRYQRENWRQAVEAIDSRSDKETIALFEFPEPFAPYEWYSLKKTGLGAFSGLTATEKTVDERLSGITVGKQKAYLFEYLFELTDKQMLVEKWLLTHGFFLGEIYDFKGVGLIRTYERNI